MSESSNDNNPNMNADSSSFSSPPHPSTDPPPEFEVLSSTTPSSSAHPTPSSHPTSSYPLSSLPHPSTDPSRPSESDVPSSTTPSSHPTSSSPPRPAPDSFPLKLSRYRSAVNKLHSILQQPSSRISPNSADSAVSAAGSDVRQFDFRNGALPTGVTLFGETDFVSQQDNSTALVLAPGAYLKLDLGLSPNGQSNSKYINDYTLTMDIRVDQMPKDRLALFQAKWNPLSSPQGTEGECFICSIGGMGILNEDGFIDRETDNMCADGMDQGKWSRVVVTQGGVQGKQRQVTYVDARLYASSAGAEFQKLDGRFAVTPEAVYVFASTEKSYMPGGISVRFIEFRSSCLSEDDEIMMRDTVWDVGQQQQKQMSLQSLYEHPPPIWKNPSFLRQFYLEGRRLCEDPKALACLALVFDQMINTYGNGFEVKDKEQLESINAILKDGSEMAIKYAQAIEYPASFDEFMKFFWSKLEAIKEGECALIPGGIAGHSMIYIVEKQASSQYRFKIVHNSEIPTWNLITATGSQNKILDYEWWSMVFKQGNLTDLYALLLSLSGKSMDQINADTISYTSIGYRPRKRLDCVSESLRYLIYRKQLQRKYSRIQSHLREIYVAMVENDLQIVPSVSADDRQLLQRAIDFLEFQSAVDDTVSSNIQTLKWAPGNSRKRPDPDAFRNMSLLDLQQHCEELNLPSVGSASDLIYRLEDAHGNRKHRLDQDVGFEDDLKFLMEKRDLPVKADIDIWSQIKSIVAEFNNAVREQELSTTEHESLHTDMKNKIVRLLNGIWICSEDRKKMLEIQSLDYPKEKIPWLPIRIEDFKAKHSHRTLLVASSKKKSISVNVTDIWLKSPEKRVAKLVFNPTIDPIIDPTEPEDKRKRMSCPEFNYFQGLKITHQETNAWFASLSATQQKDMIDNCHFTKHIRVVIASSNEEWFEYIMNWFAFVVQKRQKTRIALCFIGAPGAGKTTVFKIGIQDMVGSQLYTSVRNSEDEMKYNSMILRSVFCLFDEVELTAKDLNRMKLMISEPDLMAREMYHMPQRVKNYTNFAFACNSDPILPVGRRVAAFDVCSDKVRDKDYFDALHAASVLPFAYQLYTRDISNFSPEHNFPRTPALLRLKVAAADNLAGLTNFASFYSWWLKRLDAGRISKPGGEHVLIWTESCEAMKGKVVEAYAESIGFTGKITSLQSVFWVKLKRICNIRDMKRKSIPYAIFAPLDDCRKYFEDIVFNNCLATNHE